MTRGTTAWLLGATLLGACKPLPVQQRQDAGVAVLSGVRLERIRGPHTVVDLTSPRANLALDGTRLELEEPSGIIRDQPDGSVFTVHAHSITADMPKGSFAAVDAEARDEAGRKVTSPQVSWTSDGGILHAQAPVVVTGPNFRMTAQGALMATPHGELELQGPVEAQAWRPDGGAR